MTQPFVNQEPMKGFRRDDKEIQKDIENRIAQDKFLQEQDIHVRVDQGVASLSGTLPTVMTGNLLLDLVEQTPGVTQVNSDQLNVGDEIQPLTQTEINEENRVTTVDEVVPDIPITAEEINILDTRAVDEIKATGDTTGQDKIINQIEEGMEVVDRDGNKLGKVRLIRISDFRLGRLLAKDYYVPYDNCKIVDNRVVLGIAKEELGDQGWAVPGESPETRL